MGEMNEEKFSIDTENLKNETFDAAKKVKESIKGTNIKEESKATKGFIIDMFKNPLEKIEEVANDDSAKFFKTALFLLIIWIVILLIGSTYSTITYWGLTRIFSNLLSVIKEIIAPVIGILVISITALILNKEKKSLITVISTITITKLPLIIAELASLLTIISSNISIITSPFAKVCSVISVVLGYFGLKNLFSSDDDKSFIKTYALIQIVYYVAYIVIRLLGIYI